MFRKSEGRRRSNFIPFVILRLCLSMVMLLILIFGIYQAFKYFTGYDPIKMDPKTIVKSVLASDKPIETLGAILGLDLTMFQTEISKRSPSTLLRTGSDSEKSQNQPTGPLLFKFAVVADSHTDLENLKKALSQAKEAGAKLVIGLGDYSEVGTIAELEVSKQAFQDSGLPYYLTAGDHDFWDARDKGRAAAANFSQVFGSPYRAFADSGVKFILLSNADNYEGVNSDQINWLQSELERSKNNQERTIFVFAHEPLYHPSSDRVMGKTDPKLKSQAKEIIDLLKQYSVAQVFFGDIHSYTTYTDPDSGLKMVTAGAITADRNTQKPRYLMVDVFEGGGYNIQDTEVK